MPQHVASRSSWRYAVLPVGAGPTMVERGFEASIGEEEGCPSFGEEEGCPSAGMADEEADEEGNGC